MVSIMTYSGLGTRENKLQENTLRYDQIELCRSIIDNHPQAKKCLEAIYSRLFKYGIEIILGKTRAKLPSNIRDTFSGHAKKFAIEFIKCYYEMGIVPVAIAKTKAGDRYPVVMKEMGFITVYIDGAAKTKKYRFYKTNSRRTGEVLRLPKHDPYTIIFSGYGHDPDANGAIHSLVWSAVKKILFVEKMYSCAVISEELNCKPVIITEVTDPEAYRSAKAMGTSIDISMWYANRDRANEDNLMDKVMVNENTIRMMEQYNRTYIESWNKTLSGLGAKVTGMNSPAQPLPVPVRSLPIGQKMTTGGPKAMSRGDLTQLEESEAVLMSSLFGVPQSLFNGENRTVGGTQASSEMFLETITAWRGRLSEVLTRVFKCAYDDKLCDIYADAFRAESEKKKAALENLHDDMEDHPDPKKEALIRRIITEQDVSVQFPAIPAETVDELLKMYLLGLFPYSEFVVYSKMVAGLPIGEEDRDTKDPVDKMYSLARLQSTMEPQQTQQMNMRFGDSTGAGTDKPKKRKSEDKGEKSEEKGKKKMKKSESKDEKKEKKDKSKKKAKEDDKT